MWCVHKGNICIMVQDTKHKDRNGLRWVYIREKIWLAMTDKEKGRYIA